MVTTPWGPSDSLAERRTSGKRASREEARLDQRQRLLGAMVASCETKGFEATTVQDLLEISGLSRGTFYEHFTDKLSCFRSAVVSILQDAKSLVEHQLHRRGDPEERALAALDAFVSLVVAQPAAARLCFVHAYVAGEDGLEPVRQTTAAKVTLGNEILAEMPGREGLPLDLGRAIIAGFYRVFYDRLQRHQEGELPELIGGLWRWAMSYSPPPRPLPSAPTRRPVRNGVGTLPPFATRDPEQRIIRAFATVVAAKGYGATTIADVAASGSISQTTFYEYFHSKAELMTAALDSSGAQMLSATLPRARRAGDWMQAVRVTAEASLAFLASEPTFAELRVRAVYEAGPEAISLREQTGAQMLEAVIRPSFKTAPRVDPLTLEATFGAINGLTYEQLRRGGAESLPEIGPLLTYVSLAPLLATDTAYRVAAGEG
jgi:AcrR family transcriptional regulator